MRGRLAACAALLVVLGACTAGGTAGSPPRSTPAPASIAGSTDTGWGAILDRAPASFPRYPGAADSNGATDQPVTQAVSTSVSVATASVWYASALASTGYRQTSISNPAEDGSVVAEFDGGSLASGCRAQLTYKPMGSLTVVFVLIGASCPTG